MSTDHRPHDTFPPFQSMNDTVRSVGVSLYYLKQGIKDGTVPHVRSGRKILVNVPMLLQMLDEESTRH